MYEDNELLEHASVFIDAHQAVYYGLQIREGADQEYVQRQMSAVDCIVSAAAFQEQNRFLLACAARHHEADRNDLARSRRQLDERCRWTETEAAQWKEEVDAANRRKDTLEKDLEKANQEMARAGERASLQELRVSQLEVDLAHIKLEKKSLKTLAEERLAAITEAEEKLKKSDEERLTIQRRLDELVQEFRVAEDERFTALEANMAEYGKYVRDWVIQKYPHVDISDVNFIIPVEEREASQATTEAVATPATTETVATPLAMPEATLVIVEEQRGPKAPVEVEDATCEIGATVTVETQTEEMMAPISGGLPGESQPPVTVPKE